MLYQAFGWFFKNVTPYILGVCIGVGFFFLLLKLTSGPDGLIVNKETKKVHADVAAVIKAAPIQAKKIDLPKSATTTDKAQEDTSNSEPSAHTGLKAAYLATKSLLNSVTETPTDKPEKSRRIERKSSSSVAIAESRQNQSDTKPRNCGTSPRFPGVEMNRFLACQWRNNCLASINKSKAQFAQARHNCVMSGRNPLSCRDYFDKMEKRTSLDSCNRLPTAYPAQY
ncbi:MAG: hypothetical protein HQL70_08840 [Magnetococcales bacterium]|nr:hypothetical protein [Magnetococcales bacterium]